MGKNRKLTPAEIKEFLTEPVVARIATIDQNGMPYVTPVWQEWDGEAFWIRAVRARGLDRAYQEQSKCRHFVRARRRDIQAHHGGRESSDCFGPAPMQGQCLDIANRMAVRFLGEHGPEYLVPTYNPAALPG